jgi:hypothetical protein
MRHGSLCWASGTEPDSELHAEVQRVCQASAEMNAGPRCETMMAWLSNVQGDAASKLCRLHPVTAPGLRAKAVALVALHLGEEPETASDELARSLCADIFRLIPPLDEGDEP